MARTESSGVAKAGLTTGIIGTSLAGLLALRDGGLGGLLGGGNRVAEGAVAGAALSTISELQGKLAQANAERYADQVGASVFDRAIQLSNRNDDRINANLKENNIEHVRTREWIARQEAIQECLQKDIARISGNVADNSREIADMRVREQATSDAINCLAKTTDQRFDAVYKAIDCARRECGDAIALEAERRHAADQSIRCYVDATFVPGRLVMPKDSICPEVMPRYNTYTAPTDPAPATQPISGSVNVRVSPNNSGCGCQV